MVVGNYLPKAKPGVYLNKSGFYGRLNVNCFKDLKKNIQHEWSEVNHIKLM
jgi:hypothetical protein